MQKANEYNMHSLKINLPELLIIGLHGTQPKSDKKGARMSLEVCPSGLSRVPVWVYQGYQLRLLLIMVHLLVQSCGILAVAASRDEVVHLSRRVIYLAGSYMGLCPSWSYDPATCRARTYVLYILPLPTYKRKLLWPWPAL